MIVLALDRSFRIALIKNTYDQHVLWEISLVAFKSSFNIQCEKDYENLGMSDHTSLISHEALQSLIDLCNRHGVSHYQFHATFATTLLFSTHNYLNLDSILPPSNIRKLAFLLAKLCNENLNQLFNDLFCYIMLSCEGDVINSNLCEVFWSPLVSSNFVNSWL